jgi:hypothetical protein
MDEAFTVLDGMREKAGGQALKVLRSLEPSRQLLAALAGAQNGGERGRYEQPEAGAESQRLPQAIVLCQDPGLRDLLCDLMAEAGLLPVDGLAYPGAGEKEPPVLVVVSLDRLDDAVYASWLAEPGRAPVLLLEGYGEASRAAAVARGAHVTLLKKPFAVTDFVDAARRLTEAAARA